MSDLFKMELNPTPTQKGGHYYCAINNIKNINHAFDLAYKCKTTGFKLYDDSGCFLKEFALFDGKFREVTDAPSR